MDVKWDAIVVFICIFMMANNLCTLSFAYQPLEHFLWEKSIQIFCLFFSWGVFVFFSSYLHKILYVFSIHVLYERYDLQLFSPILWIVSFWWYHLQQEVFNVDESNSSILSLSLVLLVLHLRMLCLNQVHEDFLLDFL